MPYTALLTPDLLAAETPLKAAQAFPDKANH
jgi:hypothetical protein